MAINWVFSFFFFFQAEDGIRDQPRSRGLGDVYKRQALKGRFFEILKMHCKGVFLTKCTVRVYFWRKKNKNT